MEKQMEYEMETGFILGFRAWGLRVGVGKFGASGLRLRVQGVEFRG